jgi:hypothetical protein
MVIYSIKTFKITRNLVTKQTKKRFIAGAVCPICKAIDTMALTKENNVEKVTCVACGEQMTQPQEHVEKKTRSNEQVIGVFTPE